MSRLTLCLLLMAICSAEAYTQALPSFTAGNITYNPSYTIKGDAEPNGQDIHLRSAQQEIKIQINLNLAATNLRIKTESKRVTPPERKFPAVFTIQTGQLAGSERVVFQVLDGAREIESFAVTVHPFASPKVETHTTESSPPSPDPKPPTGADNPGNPGRGAGKKGNMDGQKPEPGKDPADAKGNQQTSQQTGEEQGAGAGNTTDDKGQPEGDTTSDALSHSPQALPQPDDEDNTRYYIMAGTAAGAAFLWLLVGIARRRARAAARVQVPEYVQPSHTAPPTYRPEPSDPEISFTENEPPPAPEAPSLASVAASGDYLRHTLRDCWRNSAVQTLYLHWDSLQGINRMVREQNYDGFAGRSVEEIPEIGGFLLGYVYPQGEQAFDLAIAHFVPITAESQDRYTVRFGDTAWLELTDAYKQYPGTKLVGWFHTHPGHGLFLSEADLREHRQLFQASYQIAVELEPTTPGFDIAFFTWQSSKKMNNAEDRLLPAWWTLEKLLTNFPHS